MKNCLIIINSSAGGNKNISFEKVEKCLGEGYAYTRRYITEAYDVSGFDAVAVCGGDGTLGSVLAKVYDKPVTVYYFPSGTMNDKAKAQRYSHTRTNCPALLSESVGKPITVGICKSSEGQQLFAYVFACGAFTPIGYTTKVETKKKIGLFAYLSQVFKEYRVHRISARINCDDKSYDGEFALIMFLKSPRCFGFHVNRAFDGESESGHLIAIRSPKHDGFIGKIEMFFPFFRTFFMGLKKEREGQIIFKKTSNANVVHALPTTYCRDGEMQDVNTSYDITFVKSTCSFNIIEKF